MRVKTDRKGSVYFKTREEALYWITEYKDMFTPEKFLAESIECGYIVIEE